MYHSRSGAADAEIKKMVREQIGFGYLNMTLRGSLLRRKWLRVNEGRAGALLREAAAHDAAGGAPLDARMLSCARAECGCLFCLARVREKFKNGALREWKTHYMAEKGERSYRPEDDWVEGIDAPPGMDARIFWARDVPKRYRRELSSTKVVGQTRVLMGLLRWRKQACTALAKRASLAGTSGLGAVADEEKGRWAEKKALAAEKKERWGEGDVTYRELFNNVLANFDKLALVHRQELLRVPNLATESCRWLGARWGSRRPLPRPHVRTDVATAIVDGFFAGALSAEVRELELAREAERLAIRGEAERRREARGARLAAERAARAAAGKLATLREHQAAAAESRVVWNIE